MSRGGGSEEGRRRQPTITATHSSTMTNWHYYFWNNHGILFWIFRCFGGGSVSIFACCPALLACNSAVPCSIGLNWEGCEWEGRRPRNQALHSAVLDIISVPVRRFCDTSDGLLLTPITQTRLEPPQTQERQLLPPGSGCAHGRLTAFPEMRSVLCV